MHDDVCTVFQADEGQFKEAATQRRLPVQEAVELENPVVRLRLQEGPVQPGDDRFRRDFLDQAGVRWVILWEGVNDIGTSHAPVAKALIAADRHLIALAHAHHLRIYAATITPFGKSFYDSPAHRADWRQLNHWIRHGGAFDGVVDFSALARDPAHPDRLLPADDLGDHLHFQPSGYARLAVAVPLRWFENP